MFFCLFVFLVVSFQVVYLNDVDSRRSDVTYTQKNKFFGITCCVSCVVFRQQGAIWVGCLCVWACWCLSSCFFRPVPSPTTSTACYLSLCGTASLKSEPPSIIHSVNKVLYMWLKTFFKGSEMGIGGANMSAIPVMKPLELESSSFLLICIFIQSLMKTGFFKFNTWPSVVFIYTNNIRLWRFSGIVQHAMGAKCIYLYRCCSLLFHTTYSLRHTCQTDNVFAMCKIQSFAEPVSRSAWFLWVLSSLCLFLHTKNMNKLGPQCRDDGCACLFKHGNF